MQRIALTGSRIRERRLHLKMRQADLARHIGISPSYLNLIEHNRRRIGGKLLVGIAEALDVDYAALTQGADRALLDTLTAAARAEDMPPEGADRAEELADRFPEWARLIAAQAQKVEQLERSVDALNDRLGHDPTLSDAMHEVLSTVTAVRSTASILATTPEIDRNWLGRFHANIDADSRRLAAAVEAMVAYFERQAHRKAATGTPIEAVARVFDAHQHHFPTLEAQGMAALSDLLAQETSAPRALLSRMLTRYAADAQALPLADFTATAAAHDYDPAALIPLAQGNVARVLRRLASLPADDATPNFGLVTCDAAGAITFRKGIEGFALPLHGAACPLWPLYRALLRPMVPLRGHVQMPDGSLFLTYAIATPSDATAFEADAPVQATMLLRRDDGGAQTGPAPTAVGTSCRLCSRTTCTARREPSFMDDPTL